MTPKIGETISAEQFKGQYGVGQTVSSSEFQKAYSQPAPVTPKATQEDNPPLLSLGLMLQNLSKAPVVNQAGNFGIGVLKGGAQMADMASGAGQWIANQTINKVPGMGGQQPIAQLPKEMTETQGFWQGAGSFAPIGAGAEKSLVKGAEYLAKKPIGYEKVLELVKPKATEELVKAGKVMTKKGAMTTKPVVATTPYYESIAKAAQKFVVQDIPQSITNLRNEVKRISTTAIEPYLKQFSVETYDLGTKRLLKNMVDKTIPEKMLLSSEKNLARSLNNIKDASKKLLETAKSDFDLYKIRQQMDAMFEAETKGKGFDPTTTKAAWKYYLELRRKVNDFIAQGLEDGDKFKGWLDEEHKLYQAIEGLAEKAPLKERATTLAKGLKSAGGIAGGVAGGVILGQMFGKLAGRNDGYDGY
jgi:hypothetical protein